MEFIEKNASNKDRAKKGESCLGITREQQCHSIFFFLVRLLNIITIELHILIESIYSLFGSSSNMS